MVARTVLWSVMLTCLSTFPVPAEDSPSPLALADDERIVLLGNTLIEREQRYGDWELLLTLTHPNKRLIFRNLGWSGDTVWAESRGMFDPAKKGYERMIRQIQELQPTVVILGYGGVEAFDGPSRLAPFETQFRKLLDDLKPSGCRFVFLAPTVMEVDSLPVRPDLDRIAHAAAYAQNVEAVCGILKKLAQDYQGYFVDLRPALSAPTAAAPLTENGLHLNAAGYAATGKLLAQAFAPQRPVPTLDRDHDAVTALRQAILEKNELYFHRWRPQNFTYLFGFRQHEQGNNAVEIPQFDPLVAAAEQRIEHLKQRVDSGR